MAKVNELIFMNSKVKRMKTLLLLMFLVGSLSILVKDEVLAHFIFSAWLEISNNLSN